MVRAWYMAEDVDDQTVENMTDPPRMLGLDEVKQMTGVLYWKLDPKNFKEDGTLDKIRKDRKYNYEDRIVCSREKLQNYDEMLKNFFQEHIHADEEIRFIVEGSGYFDVRDVTDKWIRVEVEAGDLLILPAGIYHRFTLDSKHYVDAIRLFSGDVPVWTPHYRPQENHSARKNYVNDMGITA